MLGDDRLGCARALRRIIESKVFADKTGLVMHLGAAINIVERADDDIQKQRARIEALERALALANDTTRNLLDKKG